MKSFQVASICRMVSEERNEKRRVGSSGEQDMSQTYIQLEETFESWSVSNKYVILILQRSILKYHSQEMF